MVLDHPRNYINHHWHRRESPAIVAGTPYCVCRFAHTVVPESRSLHIEVSLDVGRHRRYLARS